MVLSEPVLTGPRQLPDPPSIDVGGHRAGFPRAPGERSESINLGIISSLEDGDPIEPDFVSRQIQCKPDCNVGGG